MTQSAPPKIFSHNRRNALRQRMLHAQGRPDAPRYIINDMIEDVLERLAFLRHTPKSAFIIGDYTEQLSSSLQQMGTVCNAVDPALGFNEEVPIPDGNYDLIASLGTLDTVNDLPGALIHMRSALAPGGLMIASFIGAGSLPQLRSTMFTADGDRPAPRLHPQIDVRAGGQLMQRSAYADPVVDSRELTVRYSNLSRLLADLRDQGLSNVLANPGGSYGKAWRTLAEQAYGTQTVERFDILTLSGWRR